MRAARGARMHACPRPTSTDENEPCARTGSTYSTYVKNHYGHIFFLAGGSVYGMYVPMIRSQSMVYWP